MSLSEQHVFFFGDGSMHDLAHPNEVLGCKGANLAEMTRLGLPVPPGFTVSTQSCREYYEQTQRLSPELVEEVTTAVERLERLTDLGFGDPKNSLLVSVRSGASVSMPGMMDTVLNLGMNDQVVAAMASVPGAAHFAYDTYRRFIEMYANVVLGMKAGILEQLFERIKNQDGANEDAEVDLDALKNLVVVYKQTVWTHTGKEFPSDPYEQLWGAVAGVFESWNTKRAIEYRQLYEISQDLGTAVTVQRMVFGNLGTRSATGVALTRDPSTGEKVFYGEYLPRAQGEDVVAGLQNPRPINAASRDEWDPPSLEEEMPDVYATLKDVVGRLEQHFGDLQDIEFTIEGGKLWMLQTRTGKRSARAAIRIAVEMVEEGLIPPSRAIQNLNPDQFAQLLHPTFDPESKALARQERRVIARGLPASPGAETGPITFDPERAIEFASRGTPAILVRTETSPEDIHGVSRSAGVLTVRGGMTSHAAVVARGMGKCCVVGCRELVVTSIPQTLRVGEHVLREGDVLSLDGSTGEVFLGEVATKTPELGEYYHTLMKWVQEISTVDIRANAHTPHEVRTALAFGAQGIGLCRTEHLFFSPDRVQAVREMILASNEEQRRLALEKIKPLQEEDFRDIFRSVRGAPITMRLMDPPLHSFLPSREQDIVACADSLGEPLERVRERIERLRESNPMLGHRGCRIGVTFPELYQMQVDAIVRAAWEVSENEGIPTNPELMIPLVSFPKELELIREACMTQLERTLESLGSTMKVPFGAMIELPSAIRSAGQLARWCDFFNFGTNDLTQTTLGLSRDDAGTFLPLYTDMGLLDDDPFQQLHPHVEDSMREAIRAGTRSKPSLKLGICGDHADTAASVRFCYEAGLHYISCSPYRVPVIRLAAAHAALEASQK